MKLDLFDPSDTQLLTNPDGDLVVDPLCGWARWGCWYIDLPMLEEEYAAAAPNSRSGILNDALRLIALHQIAPPPWLAAAMLEKFRLRPPRKNARTVEKAQALALEYEKLKAKKHLSIEAMTGLRLLGPTMDRSKVNRLLKLAREHAKRLERIIDEMP